MFTVMGRVHRQSFYGQTQREAIDKERAARAALKAGQLTFAKTPTTAEYLRPWLTTRLAVIGAGTVPAYQRAIERHILPVFGAAKIDRITVSDVNAFFRNKLSDGLQPQTVHNIRAVWRKAFNDAMRQDPPLLARNVVALSDAIKREEYVPFPLSKGMARTFLDVARKDRLYFLYTLAILGPREGELLGLRWSDFDEDGYLHTVTALKRVSKKVAAMMPESRKIAPGLQLGMPKTKRVRTRKIAPPAFVVRAKDRQKAAQNVERLAAGAAWEDHGLVFTTALGRPLQATHVIEQSFNRICEEARVPYVRNHAHCLEPGVSGQHRECRYLRFHDLRHSANTLMAALGVSRQVRMAVMAHTTTAMNDHYTGVTDEELDDAARRLDAAIGASEVE